MKMKKTLMALLLPSLLAQTAIHADWTVCEEIDAAGYESEASMCMKRYVNEEYGNDDFCIECLPEAPERTAWDSISEIAQVAIPSLAMFGSAYVGAKYAYKGQKAWANAYEGGIRSCHGAIGDFQAYNLERGANAILPKEQTSMLAQCNGSSMGMYAGGLGLTGGMYGGVGMNPFISGGYTGGFLGGMTGPYFGGGVSGGMYPGMGGMYGGGMYGGGMYPGMGGQMGVGGQININNPWAALAGGALAGLLTGGGLYGNINVGMGANPYGNMGMGPYGMYGNMGMNPYGGMGLYGNMGMNPYGNMGMNPYGMGMNTGFGLNASIGNPYGMMGMNPYGNMGMNTGFGINASIGNPYGMMGMNPYGMGMNTGIGLNTGIGIGINTGVGTNIGMGPWGNGSGNWGVNGSLNGSMGPWGTGSGNAACMCISAPCNCGNTFPGGNGQLNPNWQWGVNGNGAFGPNGNGAAWGMNTYPWQGGTGQWNQGGGWQAQMQAQAFANGLNSAQGQASAQRLYGNQQGNYYANQALYQNVVNAQRDAYSGQMGAAYNGYGSMGYNSGMNYGAMGGLNANFSIGLGANAGAGYSWTP